MDYLYLVADLGNGGQERQLFYLVRSLQQQGKQVAVAVWDWSHADKYNQLLQELNISVLPIAGNGTRQKIKALSAVVKAHQPKVLHAFSFHLNFPAFVACLGKRTKAIGGIRSRFALYIGDSSLPVFLLSTFTPRYQVSNNSNYYKGFAGRWLHRLINKVHVVNNALDITAFPAHEARNEDATILSASIGRLYPEKRIDLLIQVIKKLRDNGHNIIHHHAGDGPLLADMQQLVQDAKLEDAFIFSGVQADINAFLQQVDFLVHTSDHEGYPNVVMEAMASGRPVLTTDCGDASLLIQNGENGYVVPTGDVTSLTAKAETLINDRALRVQMGAKGRQQAEEKFSIAAFTHKMLNVYNSITKEQS